MKALMHIALTLVATLALGATAFAQTAQQHVADAAAKTQSTLASTGVPLWAWIAIAAVLIIAFAMLAARRRRPTQAVIKTRLG